MNAPEPIRHDPPRTLADYQADLIARFGYMPGREELANIESRAMLAGLGGVQTRAITPDIRKAALENPNGAAVLRALEYPMTRREVCEATGMNLSTAKAAFHRLLNAGLIKRHSVTRQHVTTWERAE